MTKNIQPIADKAGFEFRVSDDCWVKLHKIAQSKKKDIFFRVWIQAGGCSGFEYKFDLVENIKKDDWITKNGSASVIIDPISQKFLTGAALQFKTNIVESTFFIENPNSASECGCGISFSI